MNVASAVRLLNSHHSAQQPTARHHGSACISAMANSNANRFWAGTGPKEIQCGKANCPGAIPTGVLCHKKLHLGLKPTCFVCEREYKVPPGAERPYLKGALKTGPGKGKGKGKGNQGGDGKDREIASLKKLLKANTVELPNHEPTQEDKEELEGLKAAKNLLDKKGLDTTDLEAKIQELEAAEKAKVLALPVIEAGLEAAKLKVKNSVARYKNLLGQLKGAKETGEAALQQLDELEAQKVTALAQQGYAPKQTPEDEGGPPQPPNSLDEKQKEAWGKAVQAHLDNQEAIAKRASEGLSKLLHDMQNNFEAANKAAREAAAEENKAAEAKAAEAKAAEDMAAQEAKAEETPDPMEGSKEVSSDATISDARELFGGGSYPYGPTGDDAPMAQQVPTDKDKRKGVTGTGDEEKPKAGRFEARVAQS